jgi:hypothetical protein
MWWVLPRRGWFWKGTDYLWLVIAALGLVGVVQRERTKVFEESLPDARARVRRVMGLARWSAEVGERSNREIAEMNEKAQIAAIRAKARAYRDAEVWYGKWLSALRESPDSGHVSTWLEELIKQLPKDNDALNQDRSELNRSLAEIREAEQRVTFYENGRKRIEIEKLLGGLAPVLLGLALAIRITKVSAELFRIQK